MTGSPPTHRLELETFEAIVRGGVRRVTWLFEEGEEWKLVSEVPEASVLALDRGPGMVWRRQVAVALPVGTRLMRVESMPKRAPAQDPLAYLLGASTKVARETRRSQFVVTPEGKLERLPPPEPSAPKPRPR